MKVVSLADSGDRGICQKSELASNLVNTLAPTNWAKVSTSGRICLSLETKDKEAQVNTLIYTVGDKEDAILQSFSLSVADKKYDTVKV